MILSTKKTGLTLGALVGSIHIVWSLLILFGWARPILNFIFGLHSLSNPYMVYSFDLVRSIELVVLTAIVGYIVGFAFASIWNKIHK